MSDQEQKEQKKESTNISPQPDAEKKKGNTELNEEELKKVSGGLTYTVSDTKISGHSG
jgi:bacteriocin-like protein